MTQWNFNAKMCILDQAGLTESKQRTIRLIGGMWTSPSHLMPAEAGQGWGTACDDCSTGGLWTAEEAMEHINFLEMVQNTVFALAKWYGFTK